MANPKFSVIIPSYLGDYKGAASERDKKIHRALRSALDQTLNDCEVIVIADGCEQTFSIIEKDYSDSVACYLIEKSPTFSGLPRNFGIEKAKGEYIIYLDIDDYWGKDHLATISSQLNGLDWVYYNDWIIKNAEWVERPCNIRTIGQNGTSNICHKRSISPRWGGGYAHDYYFIQQLLRHKRNKKIETTQYFVCHIPNVYDI